MQSNKKQALSKKLLPSSLNTMEKTMTDVIQSIFQDSINLDVSRLILSFFTKVDLGFMRLVCKKWCNVIPAQKYLIFSEAKCYIMKEDQARNLREQMIVFAVKNGSILLLKLFFQQGIREKLRYFGDEIGIAAGKGYLECIKFAYKNQIIDCSSNYKVAAYAAKYGDEKSFFWLAKKALKYGNIIKNSRSSKPVYNIEKGPVLEYYACEYACESGNLTILKACIGFGLKPGSECMCVAARNAHLHILKYGIGNNFPTNSCACANAASSGNLECLLFLIRQGIPCTESATLFAYESRRYEIMEFLLSNGYPRYQLLTSMAFHDREEQFLRLFIRYKCDWYQQYEDQIEFFNSNISD